MAVALPAVRQYGFGVVAAAATVAAAGSWGHRSTAGNGADGDGNITISVLVDSNQHHNKRLEPTMRSPQYCCLGFVAKSSV